jgi:hypothetical protein
LTRLLGFDSLYKLKRSRLVADDVYATRLQLAYQFAEANAGRPIPENAEAFANALVFFQTFTTLPVSYDNPEEAAKHVANLAKAFGVGVRRDR